MHSARVNSRFHLRDRSVPSDMIDERNRALTGAGFDDILRGRIARWELFCESSDYDR